MSFARQCVAAGEGKTREGEVNWSDGVLPVHTDQLMDGNLLT